MTFSEAILANLFRFSNNKIHSCLIQANGNITYNTSKPIRIFGITNQEIA